MKREKEANESKRQLYALSLAAMLNDIGSHIVHASLPFFMVSVFHAGKELIGLLSAIGNACNLLSKSVSGYLSDKLRKRKVFIVLGYLLSFLGKLGYTFSSFPLHAIMSRAIERSGKIRDAPRDALIAESFPKRKRARAFGVLRAFDHAGAIIGSLLLIFITLAIDYRRLMLLASVFPLLSVLLVLIFIKEKRPRARKKRKLNLRFFSKKYKLFILVTSIFAISYFDRSFLLLLIDEFKLPNFYIGLCYSTFIITTPLSSIAIGRIGDKLGRKIAVTLTYSLWSLTCALALFLHPLLLPVVFLFYGLQYGARDAIMRAFVYELSPSKWRATGISLYNLVAGISIFIASLIAGFIWEFVGWQFVYLFSLVLSLLATLLFLALKIS